MDVHLRLGQVVKRVGRHVAEQSRHVLALAFFAGLGLLGGLGLVFLGAVSLGVFVLVVVLATRGRQIDHKIFDLFVEGGHVKAQVRQQLRVIVLFEDELDESPDRLFLLVTGFVDLKNI